MAILTIPTSTTLGAYTQQVSLDDILYNFTFQFNDREGYWYFSIADETGNALRSGIKITANWPMLRLLIGENALPGLIMAIDPTDQDQDPGLADLGDKVFLVYVEQESLP